MAEIRVIAETAAKDPPYVGIQGEMLAETALGRVPELQARSAGDDQLFTYIVTTKQGAKFFVLVQAFSGVRRQWNETMATWPWDVDADIIRHARKAGAPVVLFAFDADSGQGRFLEIGKLDEPLAISERVPTPLPIGNAISEASLAQLAANFDAGDR